MKIFKLPKHKVDVLKESLWNTLIGFIVAYSFTIVVGPYILGTAITHETSFTWTLAMTVVSVVRGYVIRLYFSRKRYIKELRRELLALRKKVKINGHTSRT